MENWWEVGTKVEQTPLQEPTQEENWWEVGKRVEEQAPVQDEPLPTDTMEEEKPQPEGLTREQIVSDQGIMSDLRQWMVLRKGQQFADRTDDEVYDAFEEHMRTVESGEITLLGELQRLNRLSEDEKALANRVYQTWDNKASAWSEGWGEFGEAAWDRVSSTINPLESPTILLGFGAGKAISAATAKTAGTAALKAAIKSGGRVAAKKLARDNAIRNVAIGAAAGAAVDGGMATVLDAAYQNVRMEAGVQDEYSVGQGVLAGALGATVGGVVTGLGVGQANRQGRAVARQAERVRRINQAKAQRTLVPQLTNIISGAANSIPRAQWDAMRTAGDAFDLPQSARTMLVDTLFNPDNPGSVVNTMARAGIKIDFSEGKVANEVLGYIDSPSLPQAARDAIVQPWEQATGIPWNEAKDKLVSALAESGRELNTIMRAKMALSDKQIQAARMKNPLQVKDMGPEWLGYMQSVWKRLLVSHPATSAVNVMGWMAANTLRAPSDVLQALFTASYKPREGMRMLKASVWDKSVLYSDLIGTKEMWESVAKELAPTWYVNAIQRETFGGVAAKNPAQLHRIPESSVVKGIEGTADMAARLTLVNAQDEWTRAISGMVELDRQIRRHTGKSYAQLVRDGEEELLKDADWAGEAWARSLESALKDTFSYDYSLGKAYGFNHVARVMQEISNTPGLGFVFPFGKFVANAIAYTARHSPLGLIDAAKHFMKKEGYEGTKALADASIGMTAIGMLGKYSYEKMQEGFSWDQIENSNSDVVAITNLAPVSQLTLLGRMYEMAWVNGEEIPAEMIAAFAEQLGVAPLADVGTSEFVKIIKGTFDYLGANSDEMAQAAKQTVLTSTMKVAGAITSGFTRPIDPINDAVGVATGNNIQIDRRMAKSPEETFLLELTRYTDQMLAPILGEGEPPTMAPPARGIARPEGDIVDPNSFAGMTGLKRSQPLSWTDKALGMVNLPTFKQETRSAIPEFDNFIFGEMAPRLDQKMKELLASDFFKKSSRETKRALVKKTISEVKEQVLDEVEEGTLGKDPYLFNERRKFMTNDKVERREALAALDLEDFNPRELSYEQLVELNEYMEMYREESKDFIDMMK